MIAGFAPSTFASRKQSVMVYRKTFGISLFLLWSGWCVGQTVRLTGRLTQCREQHAVQYANIILPELGCGAVSDEKGQFDCFLPQPGMYRIQVSCIGFTPLDTIMAIDSLTRAHFCMTPQNLSIAEVSVIAAEKKGLETASKIDVMAMQHLQPSSLTDVFSLLPGGVSEKPHLAQVNTISIRQAPTSYKSLDNSALGTAVIVDGMAMSNDVNMQIINGLSSEIEGQYRMNQNNGIDIRQIGTDQIESVEIIRGIPSVQHGDLTSGVVIITRKSGVTPWEGRVKTDLNSQLLSLEKGFRLPAQSGLINAGVDYLHYYKTPTNPLETYRRLTSSLRYKNSWKHSRWNYSMKVSGHYSFNMDATRKDPELNHGQKDLYESAYRKATLALNQEWRWNEGGMRLLKVDAGYSQGYDWLRRERHVQLTGPTAMPMAEESGKGDGIYLPSNYNGWLRIEGRPVYWYLHANASTGWRWGTWHHKVKTGLNYRYEKNRGTGIQTDMTRPIYPNQAISRPRDLSRIPALQKIAFYLEDELSRHFDAHRLDVMAGVRFTMLPGLSNQYQMRNEIYSDPRINVRWNFPAVAFGNSYKLRLTLRGGAGWHTKTPTMSMLYPEPVYDDIFELNYYSNVSADLRRLYVYTIKQDVTGYNLEPARNLKKEIGLSAKLGKHQLDVTIFHEAMENGFSRQAFFKPITYRDYDESSVSSSGLTGPPALEDFEYRDRNALNRFSRWGNKQYIDKKGVEYQLILAPVKALHTSVSINGAYFKTHRKDDDFGYDSPNIYLKDEPYPYTGIYQWAFNDNKTNEWLNTNVRLDTHLPSLRLLSSVTFQSVWFEKQHYDQPDGTPLAYLTPTGERLPFRQEDANDPVLGYLVRKQHSRRDDVITEPLGLTVDLKVTKEVGGHLRVAFFVQNLFDYYQDYTNRANQVVRRSASPYFGMEANIKL